jgi:chemotaxis protein methyltransferase CheR
MMSGEKLDAPEKKSPFVGANFRDEDFQEIVRILQARRAFDLSSYKDRCIKRRIASRVRARGLSDSAHYVELLDADNDELDALLAVLTIHVSQFFRNPSTYRVIEEKVLPELIGRARREKRQKLRIWSAGCAGGEEPYSLALLLCELPTDDLEIEILASDVSQPILERATEAEYDAQRLAEVPESVRERYFDRLEGTRFRLKEDVRKMVHFDRHDLLADADCPVADLILCRNVMIYFSREEQFRILDRFAQSLGADSFLVLGRAETLVGAARHLYRSEYPIERIYRCLAIPE